MLNFGTGKYIFSEWIDNSHDIESVTDGSGNNYFIVGDAKGKRIFDQGGKPVGPVCDNIEIYCYGRTAFVTIDKVTHYMDWLSGEIYIRDITRHCGVSYIEAIMTDDGKIYLYGPNEKEWSFDKRLVKLSNIELVTMGSLGGWKTMRDIKGECYTITGRKFGKCYVDIDNRVTYDIDGNVIDEMPEDVDY